MQKRRELPDFLQTVIQRYDLTRYDVVGFCSMFEQQLACLALARLLKQRNPSLITWMGGANCEYPASRVLAQNCSWMDYIFSGPGLHTAVCVVKALLKGDCQNLYRVPGLFSKEILQKREEEGLKEETFRYGRPWDLDDLTELDYQHFFDSYQVHFPDRPLRPMLFFETSRGCSWGEKKRCSFCAINRDGTPYQTMGEEKAKEYFKNLFSYADRCQFYWATDSTLPLSILKKVLPTLDIPQDAKLFYEVRADMSEEEIRLLRQCHVTLVQAGIEALDTKTLQCMNKGVTAAQNLLFLKRCRENHIGVLWNLLVGTPGEPPEMYETYRTLIPHLVHLTPPSGIWAISYQRASNYLLDPEEYGLSLYPLTELNKKIYPFAQADLEQMAYFYQNRRQGEIYTFQKMRAIQRITDLLDVWKKRWLEGPAADLAFDGALSVRDTRGANPKRIALHPHQKALLDFLRVIRTIPELERFGGKHGLDQKRLRKELNGMQEIGLIFLDQTEAVSLVFERPPTFFTPFLPDNLDEL